MRRRRNIVGDNVRKLRMKTSLTQEELALRSGLSQGYINQLEHGKRNYTQKSLEQIAAALFVPLKVFFEEETAVASVSVSEMPTAYRRKRVDKKEFLAVLKDLPDHIVDHYFTLLKLERDLMKK